MGAGPDRSPRGTLNVGLVTHAIGPVHSATLTIGSEFASSGSGCSSSSGRLALVCGFEVTIPLDRA